MNTTEQVYKLVKQWSQAVDPSKESEALRQIALISDCGCVSQIRGQLTDQENKCVVQWLQKNHHNAYLWAKSQQCIGHPAMVWGSESSP